MGFNDEAVLILLGELSCEASSGQVTHHNLARRTGGSLSLVST
jgi:hypothetical protein